MKNQALGLIETFGYVGAVEAADACLKAAEVELISSSLVGGGLVTIIIAGEVSAVNASVNAGKAAANKVGTVVSIDVIARAGIGLERIIHFDSVNNVVSWEEKTAAIKEEKPLSDITVGALRKIARETAGISMSREQIKFAKKNELIEAIKSAGIKKGGNQY